MLLALLCFNGLSSIVAVLQVYYPGQFQWTITSVYTSRPEYLQELTIRTAAGETIFRPTGLTDIPGGAASSGFFASLLGACLLFTERRALMRGFWHAHVGWAFGPDVRGLGRYVRDLRRSWALRLTSASMLRSGS